MKIDFLFQKDGENSIKEEIQNRFSDDVKKFYMFCGDIRETGFREIEEGLIDKKIKTYMVIGVDKKSTTRGMLEDMLNYTSDVYYYSNNAVNEYFSNILIFEYSKYVYMYISASKLSDSGILDDRVIYTRVMFDLAEDIKEYSKKLEGLLKNFNNDEFEKLTKEKIEELIEKKEIFSTRQYVHTVRSISDFLDGKSETKSNDNLLEEDIKSNSESKDKLKENIEIPKVNLNDIDIDIDIVDALQDEVDSSNNEIIKSTQDKSKIEDSLNENDEDIDIKEQEENEKESIENLNDLSDFVSSFIAECKAEEENKVNEKKYNDSIENNFENKDESNDDDTNFDANSSIDINSMLFSKADMKLKFDEPEEEKEDNDKKSDSSKNSTNEETVKIKKLNLNDVTNFIFELPSRNASGQTKDSIRIPNYIQNTIPKFFGLNEEVKTTQINGANYKIRDVKIEVVDVKNNAKYMDRFAKIVYKSGQTYLTFTSEVLKNIDFEECDIARIIKLSPDIYHIEIISKDMQEYKLWDKVCNQKFKSSNRKYGMM